MTAEIKGKNDRKRIFVLVLALTVCLFSAAALAEGKLTVTEKNLLEFEGSDTAYFFAKVENTGNAAVAVGVGVGSGQRPAFSADDETAVFENYVSVCPDSAILQPGEFLYVNEFIWKSALESSDIADWALC